MRQYAYRHRIKSQRRKIFLLSLSKRLQGTLFCNYCEQYFIDAIKGISLNAAIVELYYEEVLKSIFNANEKSQKTSIATIEEEILKNLSRIKTPKN